MHLLEVEAEFVANLQAVVDWLLFAECRISTTELLIVKFDVPIEGVLLSIDSALPDFLIAWGYELKCVVLAEPFLTDRCESDAFELVPEAVTCFEIELLIEMLF